MLTGFTFANMSLDGALFFPTPSRPVSKNTSDKKEGSTTPCWEKLVF